jgi:hypothetical protein
MNFVGTGVTATLSGTVVTVTVAGGGGGGSGSSGTSGSSGSSGLSGVNGTSGSSGSSGTSGTGSSGSSGTSGTSGGGGGGITWSEVTTSQTIVVNNGYITNSGSLVTLTLPTTSALGTTVEVVGKGAGGWRIAQNAGDIIHFGNINTTTGTGGYLQSTLTYDAIRLVCTVADLEWTVLSVQGNITVI